ncbi:hypothetical protein [Faecalibaculum rodentium]|uniref:hypothetical protein n=1 Tax=Faecalibaculum rodentium TaxID=1702221 RepID=UPI003F664835
MEKILENGLGFHTSKGVFTIDETWQILKKLFSPYGFFLRVHVLVSLQRKHIRSWHKRRFGTWNRLISPASGRRSQGCARKKNVPVCGETRVMPVRRSRTATMDLRPGAMDAAGRYCQKKGLDVSPVFVCLQDRSHQFLFSSLPRLTARDFSVFYSLRKCIHQSCFSVQPCIFHFMTVAGHPATTHNGGTSSIPLHRLQHCTFSHATSSMTYGIRNNL